MRRVIIDLDVSEDEVGKESWELFFDHIKNTAKHFKESLKLKEEPTVRCEKIE